MLDGLNYGKEEKVNLLKKTQALYEYVERKNLTFSFENHTKIETIKRELK
jgi:hypothetical protein